MQLSIENFKHIIEDKKVLFITNQNSFTRNGFNKLLGSDKHQVYNDFSLNPKLTEVQHAIEKLREYCFDFIVGVGGGSAMDFAKTFYYFHKLNLTNTDQYLDHILNKKFTIPSGKLTLIPTTSGSGSEATHFSVIYNNDIKYSFARDELIPEYVIIDPIFTKDLPPKVTAYTGLDAIAHCIESFWAKGATKESKEYALQGLKLLVPNIVKACKSPTPEIRTKMARGAHFAGKAINISKTTAPHALSYRLTSHHNIPHGQAVGNLLYYFLDNTNELAEIKNIFKTDNLRNAFNKILIEIEMKIDIPILVNNDLSFFNCVNIERLSNHPFSFDKKSLKNLFYEKSKKIEHLNQI